MRFKTDATGTISIEWDDIAYVSSDQNLQVETEEGLRFLGHILQSEADFVVTVETDAGSGLSATVARSLADEQNIPDDTQ